MSVSGSIESVAVHTIRCLAMDAVQKANSGHPGTPMSLAPVAYQIYNHHLRYDPADPSWMNRDRFVLSAGHASMLLYSILHLAEVRQLDHHDRPTGEPAVSLEDIRNFRQLGSPTPGHPEYPLTSGVETTTGPLGQGFAASVGMAIASKWLGATYNRPGFELFDFNVYALGGDGCMMEGVSGEAASLAGHLELDNLCWLYDSNRITIEGETFLAFSEDVGKRFEAYGWNVLHVEDAEDRGALDKALEQFKKTTGKPTLIVLRSHIGYGAPTKQDTHAAHGEPLGAEEIAAAKRFYGFPADQSFYVPEGVVQVFRQNIGARGAKRRAAWVKLMGEYKAKHPELADQVERIQSRRLPEGWDRDLKPFAADAKGQATRQSGGTVLNQVARGVPWLIGGSADLAPSTKTLMTFEGAGHFGPESVTGLPGPSEKGHGERPKFSYGGRNMHFGIREFAMCAVLNGMGQSRLRPFGATFFVFTDYARPAMRLAAISETPVIYAMTHDSIGVGEDGPTHQPVEHLPSLRAMPNLVNIRPGDANEVLEAWRVAMGVTNGPVCLVLSRQNAPTLDRSRYAAASGLAKGAYVLAESLNGNGKPAVIVIGSGTELSLAVEAYERLAAEGVAARVVSMPSWELFEKQSEAYREAVLPGEVTARVSVEMGSVFGWERYVGRGGASVGMRSFGASGPGGAVQKHFGITTEAVVEAARRVLEMQVA